MPLAVSDGREHRLPCVDVGTFDASADACARPPATTGRSRSQAASSTASGSPRTDRGAQALGDRPVRFGEAVGLRARRARSLPSKPAAVRWGRPSIPSARRTAPAAIAAGAVPWPQVRM